MSDKYFWDKVQETREKLKNVPPIQEATIFYQILKEVARDQRHACTDAVGNAVGEVCTIHETAIDLVNKIQSAVMNAEPAEKK